MLGEGFEGERGEGDYCEIERSFGVESYEVGVVVCEGGRGGGMEDVRESRFVRRRRIVFQTTRQSRKCLVEEGNVQSAAAAFENSSTLPIILSSSNLIKHNPLTNLIPSLVAP